jgi:hypothetical protein
MTLQNISVMVEQSIRELRVDPIACRGQKEGQWTLKYKDSNVWIDVFNYPEKPERYYFQVMSPLCEMVDRRKEEFAINLLEINYNLYGCAICKKDNWLYVLSLREAQGLDQSEIDATIDRVAIYSSDYWSKLSFKFEGCWDKKQ